MGGLAFTTPPYGLHTPRMPPAVYNQVKASCMAKLSELYAIVASPVDAPAKKDFGDVDFLVAEKKQSPAVPASETGLPSENDEDTRTQLLAIGGKLQASHSIILSPPVSANFAIPWPAGTEQEDQDQKTEDTREKFIQVDVRICKDEQQVKWALFKHAHGDIWNILGSTIRPHGLTVDEQALWLRIPEIEKHDKKKAKVRLTENPAEVLEFLGMKYDEHWTSPFDSVEELYDYVTACRLPLVRYPWLSDGDVGDAASNSSGATGTGEDTAAETRKQLKSNDRRRMNQRHIYRRWINDMIPQLLAEGRLATIEPEALPAMRAEVEQQAFERFPSVKEEYDARLKAWRMLKSTEAAKRAIKELIPDKGNQLYRGTLMSAMRKIILEGDQSFGILPGSPFKTEDGVYDLDVVRKFITEQAEVVGAAAWERHYGKARAAMDAKKTSQLSQEMTGLGF
ncbi:hypothetical protein V8F20_006550 [Naviculisporaceae sp. PSN 640]